MKTISRIKIINTPPIVRVFGVDYSGAALSGKTAWIAETEVLSAENRLRLVSLKPIGTLAGSDERASVNAFLVATIRDSKTSLWGMDFPFGLPIELGLGRWPEQLCCVAKHEGGAKEFGRSLVDRSQQLGHGMHIRRLTDRETQTPFDCYHYRIIYQTFHGMRDVLLPLSRDQSTCVLPFQYHHLNQASRWIVEACPSSTLKRLALPYRLYKQSARKPPTVDQQMVRKKILAALTHCLNGSIDIPASYRRIILNDSGGDALDSVIAAVGSFHDFCNAEHMSILRHKRYPIEGRVFC